MIAEAIEADEAKRWPDGRVPGGKGQVAGEAMAIAAQQVHVAPGLVRWMR